MEKSASPSGDVDGWQRKMSTAVGSQSSFVSSTAAAAASCLQKRNWVTVSVTGCHCRLEYLSQSLSHHPQTRHRERRCWRCLKAERSLELTQIISSFSLFIQFRLTQFRAHTRMIFRNLYFPRNEVEKNAKCCRLHFLKLRDRKTFSFAYEWASRRKADITSDDFCW